jgi:hypothetical protein
MAEFEGERTLKLPPIPPKRSLKNRIPSFPILKRWNSFFFILRRVCPEKISDFSKGFHFFDEKDKVYLKT